MILLALALGGCSGPGVDQVDGLRVEYIHGNLEQALFAQVVVDAHNCESFSHLEGSTLEGVFPRRIETVPNTKVPDPHDDGWGFSPEMTTDCGYSILHFDLARQDRLSNRAELVLSGAEEDLSLELFGNPFRELTLRSPEVGWTQPWVEEMELTFNQDILNTERAFITATLVEEGTDEESQSEPLVWDLEERSLSVDLGEALQPMTALRVTQLELSGFEYSYLSCPEDILCSIRGSYAAAP